jgi:hypothetical protein
MAADGVARQAREALGDRVSAAGFDRLDLGLFERAVEHCARLLAGGAAVEGAVGEAVRFLFACQREHAREWTQARRDGVEAGLLGRRSLFTMRPSSGRRPSCVRRSIVRARPRERHRVRRVRRAARAGPTRPRRGDDSEHKHALAARLRGRR